MDGFLFPHLAETDTREPIFVVTIPKIVTNAFGINNNENDQPIQLGFLMLSLPYWIELLGFVLLTLSFAAIVGLVLYQKVVKPKLERTFTANLVGWGLIIPLWVSWPYFLFRIIDLKSAIFRFLVGGIAPIVCSFRTLETIYGLCPTYVTTSSREFVFSYATVPIVARTQDGSKIPCTNSKKLQLLRNFLGLLCLTGVLQSILVPHNDLNVFSGNYSASTSTTTSTSSTKHLEWFSVQRYYTWELYANSGLQALLFQLYLTTYLEGLAFFFGVLTGCEAEQGMLNPLLESKSPTDFWGKRWNTMIHKVLKQGVYKPLRQAGFHRLVCILGTFVASGLFHEWLLWLVFVNEPWYNSGRTDSYQPNYGGALVFFAWQALIMAGELVVFGNSSSSSSSKTHFVTSIAKELPQPLKTFLVIAVGIPFAHYFLEPYARSNFFFKHGNPGLPMWVRV